MTDVFSKAKRSEVMARIHGKGNRDTELEFMRLLRRDRISGWRRHLSLTLKKPNTARSKHIRRVRRVSPDFVFPQLRVAIFVDGCFWHGCPTHCTTPASNVVFWRTKLDGNRTRDRYVTKTLRRQKWVVLRFWEHQMRHGDRVIARLRLGLDRALTVRKTKPSTNNDTGRPRG
jgi:DNA mismatch endonuclease (patch repair protein)